MVKTNMIMDEWINTSFLNDSCIENIDVYLGLVKQKKYSVDRARKFKGYSIDHVSWSISEMNKLVLLVAVHANHEEICQRREISRYMKGSDTRQMLHPICFNVTNTTSVSMQSEAS